MTAFPDFQDASTKIVPEGTPQAHHSDYGCADIIQRPLVLQEYSGLGVLSEDVVHPG
jgi:hypothetical protein